MPKKLLPLFILCLLLTACAADHSAPTGVPAGQIEQPQVMYDGQVYVYYATGFDAPLPSGFQYVGSIENVDHYAQPAENFAGCQLELGQKLFASSAVPDDIYVAYGEGYAKFSRSPEAGGLLAQR